MLIMRKICVVTGSRAEYGLLYWLMKEIRDDKDLCLQIVATGMHLSPEFGLTYHEIERDHFTIDAKVEMLLSSDTPVGIAKSMGLGTIGFADAFARLQPDLLVLLGDRFEILSAAQAALVSQLPIAHISGGEKTEGAIDDSIRHAVTKMSHIHFVANEEYRKRVIQLGENPQHVFNYGDVGVDNITRIRLLSQKELEKDIGFTLGELSFLVTYHPTTLENENQQEVVIALLDALDEFPTARIILTKPNADAGGREIANTMEDYASRTSERVFITSSLGTARYLSAMKHCTLVIGNSSSGIVEAPVFKKATVNIGSRQHGRLMANSIISCNGKKQSIINAITQALSNEFQDNLQDTVSLYGTGGASVKIKEELKNRDIKSLALKKFHDIDLS